MFHFHETFYVPTSHTPYFHFHLQTILDLLSFLTSVFFSSSLRDNNKLIITRFICVSVATDAHVLIKQSARFLRPMCCHLPFMLCHPLEQRYTEAAANRWRITADVGPRHFTARWLPTALSERAEYFTLGGTWLNRCVSCCPFRIVARLNWDPNEPVDRTCASVGEPGVV